MANWHNRLGTATLVAGAVTVGSMMFNVKPAYAQDGCNIGDTTKTITLAANSGCYEYEDAWRANATVKPSPTRSQSVSCGLASPVSATVAPADGTPSLRWSE